jgi:hypothetical protein
LTKASLSWYAADMKVRSFVLLGAVAATLIACSGDVLPHAPVPPALWGGDPTLAVGAASASAFAGPASLGAPAAAHPTMAWGTAFGAGTTRQGNTPPPSATRTSLVTGAATRITAWGVLVDDPSGRPLGQEPVKLMPWKPCRFATIDGKMRKPETMTCPTPVATTSTTANGHFVLHAPPGHYLLVIGSDSTAQPPVVTRPTIHDNVTIATSPKVQHLLAPGICTYNNEPHCLPPIALYTPHPMEVNGDYRLSDLTGPQSRVEEWPCIAAFDAARGRRGLIHAVVDEWATENVRAIVHQHTAHVSSTPPPVDPFGFLTTGNTLSFGGSPPCAAINAYVMGGKWPKVAYPRNPQTLWFAGEYHFDPAGKYSFGSAEFPVDPRTGFKDPYSPAYWP